MGTAIIELNDSAIQCQHGGTSITVPGYALLTGQGVVTGNDALHQAWLLPQQSHNQYWHQLSLSPLAGANRYARHHADLAYAQLQSLYRDAGKPENIIFAVPGSFTNDQLSILLGLAKASPFNAAGLVDAAVATVCHEDISGDILYLDIQLHTSVISRLECGAQVSRVHAGQYPDISLKGFYDTWAHFIADKFISQYRYDPMHTAQSEQELRNRLPGWLAQLSTQEEIDIELSAQQGNFTLNILRGELVAANSQRWQRMAAALSSAAIKDGEADSLLISHRVRALPGVEDYIEYSDYSEPDAVINACQSLAEHIISDTGKLSFVTELPLLNRHVGAVQALTQAPGIRPHINSGAHSSTHSETTPATTSLTDLPPIKSKNVLPPSHLLHQHKAHPLALGLSITLGIRGLDICSLADFVESGTDTSSHTRAAATKRARQARESGELLINCEAKKVTLHTDQEKLPIQCSGNLDNLQVGDEIIIRGETLKFIEVL